MRYKSLALYSSSVYVGLFVWFYLISFHWTDLISSCKRNSLSHAIQYQNQLFISNWITVKCDLHHDQRSKWSQYKVNGLLTGVKVVSVVDHAYVVARRKVAHGRGGSCCLGLLIWKHFPLMHLTVLMILMQYFFFECNLYGSQVTWLWRSRLNSKSVQLGVKI